MQRQSALDSYYSFDKDEEKTAEDLYQKELGWRAENSGKVDDAELIRKTKNETPWR